MEASVKSLSAREASRRVLNLVYRMWIENQNVATVDALEIGVLKVSRWNLESKSFQSTYENIFF